MELKALLSAMAESGSSDMHLVAGQPPAFRVGRRLERQGTDALTAADIEGLLSPYISPEQQAALRADKADTTITIREEGRAYRCQLFLERGRLGAAVRAVPMSPPTLEDLEQSELMQPILRIESGLVLVTGQTGSGKSATTAAIVEQLNRTTDKRIFTLEEPIEFEFTSKRCLITQHAVGEDVAGFETGFQMVTKSDADIVVIGELRTLEACWAAMNLADTGRLVFTVLHSCTVNESLQRLIDVFPEPRDNVRRLLSRSLAAVVSQQLLPRSDRPGRVAADELLLATPHIRRMIAEGQTDMAMAIEAGRAQGMQSMDDSVLAHYKNGVISYETAWQAIKDRDRLGPPAQSAA